jgi:hypothetical protein
LAEFTNTLPGSLPKKSTDLEIAVFLRACDKTTSDNEISEDMNRVVQGGGVLAEMLKGHNEYTAAATYNKKKQSKKRGITSLAGIYALCVYCYYTVMSMLSTNYL